MNKGKSGRIRILVVDDELMILEVYKEFLSSSGEEDGAISKIDDLSRKLFGENAARTHTGGYDVTACRQGEEAVRAVEESIQHQDPFALAFIDIRMPPGPDGVVTAGRIRQMDPAIEIVMVTGFSDYDPQTIAQQVPPAHKLLYIQKPIYPHEITQFAASLSAKWMMEKEIEKSQREMEDRIRIRTKELEAANQKLLIDMEKRRRAEQALGESEEKFKSIVANISDYVCVHDLDGNILETNLNFKQQLGFEGDPRHTRIQTLIPEKYRDEFAEYLTRIRKSGFDEGTMILQGKGGVKRIVEYRNRLSTTSSGEVRVIGSGRDVTEQLQTQKALRESEMLFRMLFENAGDAIFIIKAEKEELGQILAANQAAADMHGYTLDELLRLKIMDLDSKEDLQRIDSRVKAILNGEWIRERIHHRRKDGAVFPVEISAGLLRWEGKKYILAFDRDISEQVKAENNVRLSEEKYRQLIDNAQDAIFILQDGKIQFANPSTLNIFNDTLENLCKGPFLDLVKTGDRSMVKRRLEGCLQYAGTTGLFYFGAKQKQGNSLWLQMTGVRVVWENTASLLCFVRDMTETKQLEKQLVQVQKMEALGTLAGGIAHDFNNILSVILGNIQLLSIYLGKEEKITENINRVMQAAYRAKELVSQILTFSRKADEQSRPVHIRLVIKEAVKLLRASTPSNIDIHTNFDKDVGNVLANPTQIQQVFLNLSSNAVHAMKDAEGILRVCLEKVTVSRRHPHSTLPEGDYVVLEIADTGSGMDEHIVRRIFDPYFTTKDPGEGTGLGLSIVHGIVQKLNGHIDLTSTPGKGTTFKVYFPRAFRKDAAEDDSGHTEQGANEHILLVDDEQMLLETLGDMMEDLGYRVSLAVSSEQALEMFKAAPEQYDLIVTDLTMPQMNGIDLAAKIKEIRPDIPVALHTGLAAEISKERLDQAGIKHIIRKPALEEEFAPALRRLLSKESESE